ncbi:MAG: hydroxymethylbilane synthase [Thermoplasmata archaeon]
MTERVRVGTRRSPLARAQTDAVVARLGRLAPSWKFEVVAVETSGDRDRSLGGSPDFTDAIDRALLRGEVDLAVHSAKDLPADLDRGLELVACPRRADARDCLILGRGDGATGLVRGARVGSSSLRRRAQLLRWRPDLTVVEIRGNVDSRIGLVRSDALDAAILAVAGVSRLGRASEISQVLPASAFLPAPAQGALAIVDRAGDAALSSVIRRSDHPPTHACVRAERAFSRSLGGDCNVPLGGLATVRGTAISIVGEILTPDGRTRLRGRSSGPVLRPEAVGDRLGKDMLDRGASELLGAPRP